MVGLAVLTMTRVQGDLTAAGTGPVVLAPVGQLGGGGREPHNVVAATGDYLLMAEGLYVRVVDPAGMRVVGASPLLPGLVEGVSIGDGLAFAALGPAGLAILDLVEPRHPRPVALVPAAEAISYAEAAGGRLYVADRGSCGPTVGCRSGCRASMTARPSGPLLNT